ncbi:MAG TPA: substrate-binding domain-containing protein, partial [Anaerolineales bacterium]|nr:substrate-binding domain-containing protein [Anaerolineales bacterium]
MMRFVPSKSVPFTLVAILLLLPACLAAPTSTPLPTLQPIDVAITPSLVPVQEALHTCALAQPEIALLLTETTAPFLPVQSADLSLWFGPPPDTAGFAARLSDEQILVVVNPANPISKLTAHALRSIFNGENERWDELGGEKQPVQVWVYPEGDEISQVFQEEILAGRPFSSLGRLAPDPSAML